MKTSINHPTYLKIAACRNAAFSLVEVVLAVGIMALGVVTILGLLPHGMEMSLKTANEQAETRIVDQITGEMQSSDWDTMAGVVSAGTTGITRIFDDQGLELPAGSALVTYLARVRLLDASETTNGARIPSGTRNGPGTSANKNLRRVMVEVAVTQDLNFNFNSPPPAISVKRFTQLIPKMRK